MIFLHGLSYSFATTLTKMATGEKAYGFRSSHDRLSASTTQARGSETEDTNGASLS